MEREAEERGEDGLNISFKGTTKLCWKTKV
jgi:hypothetical protein